MKQTFDMGPDGGLRGSMFFMRGKPGVLEWSHPALRIGAVTALALVQVSCATQRKNAGLTAPVLRGEHVRFDSSVSGRLARDQQPEYPTHAELVQLSRDPVPKGPLAGKLERLWRTPLVSNAAWRSGVRPRQNSTAHLGKFLRVASWNIEKSMEVPRVIDALTSPKAFNGMISDREAPEGSAQRDEMIRQRERLATADIIFLQEMDIGVNRSGYINAAEEMARALKMNYAYGVQALEVDPVLLGLEPVPDENSRKPRFLPVDPARYKGAFGTAILSRYPILKVEVFQLKTHPYDWHTDERKRTDIAEAGRRLGTELAFDNKITRELKVGGRCFFRVDIAVPGVPGGVVTLVNNHLEIKTLPKYREAQMSEILSYLKDVRNPVIMGGDHNSAPNDVSPTSVERLIWRQVDTPSSLVATASNVSGVVWGTMIPLYRERGVINALKNFQSPLAPDIPVIFPNRVLGLFSRVREYRFDDGSAFDMRGDRANSINGRSGLLANSNERRLKGQVTSFSVKRPIGPLGQYRLDWFFVKSGFLTDPTDKDGSYRLAPHFGETLVEFNEHVKSKFSDHRPIVIDIPLDEPGQQES